MFLEESLTGLSILLDRTFNTLSLCKLIVNDFILNDRLSQSEIGREKARRESKSLMKELLYEAQTYSLDNHHRCRAGNFYNDVPDGTPGL